MQDILEIIKNINTLYENDSSLAILKDFERVLDEMDMYAYENWQDGELAAGPFVDRHWIRAQFMWPKDKMPNPVAAKRLTELGCKVKYEKSHLIEPRKIKSPNDIRPGTKKGKLDHKPIWIVEISMPKKVALDIYRGYMDKRKLEAQNNKPIQGGPAPAAGAAANAAPTTTGVPPAPAGGPAPTGGPATPPVGAA